MSDENAVERIQEMEEILDRANKVIDEIGSKISELEALQPDIQKLEKYYTGKEWKADFKLDEEEKLPSDLKRGVLSEDAVYDLLERNRELRDKFKE